jgi:hypothetical protein
MEPHRLYATRRRTSFPFVLIVIMALLVLILPYQILRTVFDDDDDDIGIHSEGNSSVLGINSLERFWGKINKTLNDLMLETNDDMDFEYFLTKSEETNDFGQKVYHAVTTNPLIAAKKSSKFNSKAIRFHLEDLWLNSINETDELNVSLPPVRKMRNVSKERYIVNGIIPEI